MEINSDILKLVALQEKGDYLQVRVSRLIIASDIRSTTKQKEWAQTLARIRSAELDDGPLSPGKSFFQNWTSTYNSDEDEDFVSKRGKIEVGFKLSVYAVWCMGGLFQIELPILRKHLSGLEAKKIYPEKQVCKDHGVGAAVCVDFHLQIYWRGPSKAKLRQLRVDIQEAERRCEDLSSNISNILALTALES